MLGSDDLVMIEPNRWLRLALALCVATLLCVSAAVGGLVQQFQQDALPPYTAHVLVTGGGPGRTLLAEEDLRFLSMLSGVRAVHARTTRLDTLSIRTASGVVHVAGTVHQASRAWPALAGFRVVSGRMWSDGEHAAGSSVALLSGAWTDLPALIILNGRSYSVVGLLAGPDESSGPSRAVWIPRNPHDVPDANVHLVEVDTLDNGAARVATALSHWVRSRHGLTAAGQLPLSITTFGAARQDLAMIRRGLFLALAVLFAIPGLFLGAAMAAITRFTIAQRIPEIGLRRALGATRQQIQDLFVYEALVLSLGATWRGLILATVALIAMKAGGMHLAPPMPMVVLACLFPSLIGFAFTVPQAVSAAEVEPARALAVR